MTDVALIGAGEMGSAVATLLVRAGHRVRAVLAGRSARTRARAQAAGIEPVADLDTLLGGAGLVLSIVPPAAALPVALECARAGLAPGAVYADLNAIAPATVRLIATALAPAGAVFVDGGIIGPAPRRREDARLYLSGPRPAVLAQLAGALDLRWVGEETGLASALKLCFAASTKAVSALHLTLLAAAERSGVARALHAELALSQPELLARLPATLPLIPARAHRWVAEMQALGALLADLGLPGGAAHGAAETFAAVARLPGADADPADVAARPDWATLVRALAGTGDDGSRG